MPIQQILRMYRTKEDRRGERALLDGGGGGLPLWPRRARLGPQRRGRSRNDTSVGGRAEKEEGASAEAEQIETEEERERGSAV